jgi:CBS domain-containing protein
MEESGGLPVVDDDGRLVGYLGQSDILRAICPGYLGQLADTEFFIRDLSAMARSARRGADEPVERHMSRETAVLHAGDSATHAAELFLHLGLRSLPVVDDEGRVLGVLRAGDLVAALLRAAREMT